MTHYLRTVALSVGLALVFILLFGWTPASDASIVINDLRRTVEAHAEYSFTSIGPEPTESDTYFAEHFAMGSWLDEGSAMVAFADGNASQDSVVQLNGSNLTAGGTFYAEGSANPPVLTQAIHNARSSLSLTFTINSTMQYLLSGEFVTTMAGPTVLEGLPSISLMRVGEDDPLAFEEFAFTDDKQNVFTDFQFSGELTAGTYILELDSAEILSRVVYQP